MYEHEEERFYDSLEEDEPEKGFFLVKPKKKNTRKAISKLNQNLIKNCENIRLKPKIKQHSKIPVAEEPNEIVVNKILCEEKNCWQKCSKAPKAEESRNIVEHKTLREEKKCPQDIPRIVPLLKNEKFKKPSEEYSNNLIVNNQKKDYLQVVDKKTNIKDASHDFTKVVPLYTGDLPKNKIYVNKKKMDKVTRPVISTEKPKKTYLSMYYDKINRVNIPSCINNCNGEPNKGSNTSRAVCDVTSPKEDIDENMMRSFANPSDDDSEHEFYNKFMNTEIETKNASSPYATSYPSLLTNNSALSGKKDVSNSKSTSRLKAITPEKKKNFPFTNNNNNNSKKLELLRRRQDYGTRMSMLNRIKLAEIKTLKHIKANYEEQLSKRSGT